MTVIEFIHHTPIKNMVSCLAMRPEKVMLLGDSQTAKEELYHYKKLVKAKNMPTVLFFVPIQKNNLQDIVKKISDIVETEKDCVFDLTGGEDLALVAMGMVYQKYGASKNIQMHRFDIAAGTLTDCDNDGVVPVNTLPQISVTDQIMLHGGRITAGSRVLNQADDATKSYVDTIWELCKKNPGNWNKKISILSEYEKNSVNSLSVHTFLNGPDEKNKKCASFLKELQANGLIFDFIIIGNAVSYSYAHAIVQSCMQKAGNALEYKTQLLANQIIVDHKKLFYDSMQGVEIDWDGYTVNPNGVLDVKNEMDVVLIRGLVPVFISCKNGAVNEDELYKLQTVAERFGGKYAKKILIMTQSSLKNNGLHFFMQRAKNMQIEVIYNVNQLSDEAFSGKIQKAVTE